MIDKIMNYMSEPQSNDKLEDDGRSRRLHSRRASDMCIGMIENERYPVENWSMGGMLLSGDSRLFKVGDSVPVTLKFKMRSRILDVAQEAIVIRKSRSNVALQFKDITKDAVKKFQSVIEDSITQEFVNSQA